MKMDQKTAIALMEEMCKKQFGCAVSDATKQQLYKALCLVVKDILIEKNVEFSKSVKEKEEKRILMQTAEHSLPSARAFRHPAQGGSPEVS